MSEESPDPIEEIPETPEVVDEAQVPIDVVSSPAIEPAVSASESTDATPEELVAAKWYTTGFLVVIGLLSIVAFVVMVIVAIRMLNVVVY